MSEWGVVGVIIALAGLIATVVAPMIKVSTSLTKTTTILDSVIERLNKLEVAGKESQDTNRDSHSRIHKRIDVVEDKVNEHEIRITSLENTGGK